MASIKFEALFQRRTNRITRVLIYAVLEWTLISLLLLNSLFSLLIHKFANFFGLKPPCIFCSRLDHNFLQSQKTKTSSSSSFSLDIVCEQHAAEISKIGYCSHHRKLVESQSMCLDCSSSTSHDTAVFSWMREIGIVRTNDDDGDADYDDVKNCSCCDGVIKSSSLGLNTGDLAIDQRGLLDSDLKFGYEILDDDDELEEEGKEGDVGLKPEKEPLLKSDEDEDEYADEDDKNINNNDIVTDGSINLCPDMLPQHLEFYIDHDDYRLIPVDLVNSVNVQKQVISSYEENSNEFELVFEGDDLLSGCLFINKENLPCIKEEEEDMHRIAADEEEDEPQLLLSEEEEEGEKIVNSQPQQEENKVEERSFETKYEQEDKEMEVSQPHQKENQNEESSLPTLQEEAKEKIEISQSNQEENKIEERSLPNLQQEEEKVEIGERSLASVQEEEEETMEISQHLEENKTEETSLASVQEEEETIKIGERSLASMQEEEEETMGISQHLEEKKIERSLASVQEEEEEEETMEISQHFEENKIEERSLASVQEEEEEEEETMEISQHLEENKIEERSLASVQEEEEEEETMEISQHIMEENKIKENSSATLQHEEEIMKISQHFTEENKIEEKSSATLQHEEETIEEDSVYSQPCQEENTEIDNAVQDEISTAENTHILQVQEEEGRVTKPTEMVSSPLDCYQREESEAEVNGESLKVNVSLSEAELEEERIPDTPSSVESLHNLHKKLLVLGRRESATEESLDGSIVSEVECGDGSAIVEKLKSEIHTERKALRALYKELEEERSASAIAANQTMAMINRLQEEKATMQMEALQYQRMLEEQSEYDQEALQMMNELMVKREKEKQELEKELEVLRKKVVDYEERERMRLLSRRREGSMRSRNSSASCSYGEESDGLSIDLNHEAKDHEEDGASPHSHEENGHQDTPTEAVLGLQESLASFEEERQAILEQLKALEEKLFTLAEEEEEHIEDMKPLEQFYQENGRDFDANGGDNGFSHVNGKHQQEKKLNGSMQKRLLPLFDATELIESQDGELQAREEGFDYLELNKSPPIAKFELEKKRVAIEEEVDIVYERLHALEADREFLKHCIGSLRKGDKGLDLLQEILQHLRDLKSVELQAIKNMDHCTSV